LVKLLIDSPWKKRDYLKILLIKEKKTINILKNASSIGIIIVYQEQLGKKA